ncbi:type II secretion system F family protein [bacterium]|nr:type II secretion system F family protein [bacterium]
MPAFNYVATDARGKEVRGVVEAETQALAINQVREMKFFPLRVTERRVRRAKARPGPKGGGGMQMQIKIPFLTGRVRSKQLTPFTRQLSTLIDAGLPLVRSLGVLRNQMKPCALKDILGTVAQDVEGGSTFSEALAKHPRVFSRLFINMVRAGEVGGVLDKVLQRLSEFAEKSAALIRKIKGAMVYPVVVIFVIVGVLAVIFKFVMPSFIGMFGEMEMELPKTTLILISISDFFRTKKALLIPIVIIGVMTLYQAIKKTARGGYAIDKINLKLPLVGPLVQKMVVARFSRTLGTLIASGVPILQALAITKETAGNEVVARAVGSVHDSIREGESIAGPLGSSKVFPPLVTNMIDVGEETGNLDQMLMKVADTYDDEVDVAVTGLTSIMEPVLIIFMGVIVGFIVISLFLPLIGMAMQMG